MKLKELPELDDDFAAEVSEFDTLEESKADIKAKIKEQKQAEGELFTDIAVNLKLIQSKGEAKRLIQGGGMKLDGEKITDIQAKLEYNGKDFVVLQVGKRNFVKLVK